MAYDYFSNTSSIPLFGCCGVVQILFLSTHHGFGIVRIDVVENPDGDFLHLRPCPGGMLLQHLGTGSKVVISSRCVLNIENGMGFLNFKYEQDPDELDWASAWLNTAALAKHCDKTIYTERDFHILSLADNKVTARDAVLLCSFKVSVVKISLAWQSPVYLEAYVSEVASGESFVRWGLSRLVHHVRLWP